MCPTPGKWAHPLGSQHWLVIWGNFFITFIIVGCIIVVANRACFPSVAKVKVENGKSVTMSELQIGDRVQTGKKSFTAD